MPALVESDDTQKTTNCSHNSLLYSSLHWNTHYPGILQMAGHMVSEMLFILELVTMTALA